MRVFKWVGIVLGSVLALAVVGVVLVAMFFDPNHYKADIERLAEQKTHRKLTLEGELKLSVFPWLAVQLGAAQLGERPGFGTQPFVTFQQARLSIRLMPLLRGNVEIGDVLLDKPSIRLITDERGVSNWSDLTEGETSTPKESDASANSTVNASLASLRIQDGTLNVEDRKAKTHTAVRDFNLSTGNISGARPFDLKLSMNVEKDNAPVIPVKISATVTADFDAQQHLLKDFQFDSRWHSDGAKKSDGMPLSLRVQSLTVNTKQQTVNVDGLGLAIGDLKLTGTLVGKEIFDALALSGKISVAEFSPRDLMRQAGIDPPVTRDAAVLKKASLNAEIDATKTSAAMKNVELKLDDTLARGELSIVDFDATALRFELNVDRMDFDRYLPPPAEAPAKNTDAKESPPTPIPVEMLRTLNARGNLRIGEAKFSGMKLSKLHLGVNAREGDVRLAPTDAAIYGGDYKGTLSINVAGKVPQLNIESHASNIDFAPLFKDLFETQKISGRGQMNIKAGGTGVDTLAMQKTLSGNVDFNVTNGAFEGTDLWYEIKRARAVLNREAVPERAAGAARTVFTACKGTGVIQNGVLTNNDLDMSMQFLKVAGQGTVDVVKSTLDYRLNVQVLRMNDDPSAAELVDAQIPVKITGPLASPSVRPDVQGMVKARVKQEVEKQKEKVREKLQDKLQDLLRR